MGAEHELFPGQVAEGVVVFGQVVDVWLLPEREEIRRRRARGAGPITAPDGLRALMQLPVGLPVPLVGLGATERLALDQIVEAGAAEVVGDTVVRRAVAPVRLTGLVARPRTWAEAQAVTLLRTHAPRLVVAPPALARRVVRDIDPDVGVVVAGGAGPARRGSVLVRPPGRRWVRPSWRRWLVAETAFAAWSPRLSEQLEPG